MLFRPFSVVDGLEWFWMENLLKNIQVMLEFLKGPFLVLLLLYIPDDVICNIAIYGDVTTLYSKCDEASDLWPQLELSSEIESDP